MSRNRPKMDEFTVGLTVLIALVILVGGVLWGKGVRFRARHQTYTVLFPEVYGLKEGSSVLVNGVARGKVGSVKLITEGASVEILLDSDVVIHDDYKVILFSPQLMGGRTISIDPGEGPGRIKPGDLLQGEVPAGVGEVMASSGKVLEELLVLIHQLRTTTARVDSAVLISDIGPRLRNTLADLNNMTSALRVEMAQASLALKVGAEEVAASGQELHALLKTNRPRADSLLIRLNRVSNDMEYATKNVRRFSDALADTTGTIGMLMYSDTLHAQLVRTLSDIDSLVAQLKKEGVKVSIF